MREALPDDFAEKTQLIKANTTFPIIAGFGIAQRNDAKQVLQYVDGVVVGSLFVKALAEGATMTELTTLALKINPLISEED